MHALPRLMLFLATGAGFLPLELAWRAVDSFVGMNIRAKRAEVPANVDGIRTAQLAYDAAFDEFVETPVWPRAVEDLGKGQHPWGGSEAPEAWNRLGWAPDGEVRGAYRAEVVTWPGAPYTNSDFVVHGWIDIDGDGQVAHYTATKSIRTTLVTDPGVY